MVDISNLKTDAGLGQLNDYLATRSYIEGYQPTSGDVAVHVALGKAPDAKKFPHVSRHYNHLSSFSDEERAKFAKGQTTQEIKNKNKEEEIDLFGDEEDPEAEAAHEKELAKKVAASGKVAKKVIGKSSLILDVKAWDDETDLVEMERLVRSVQMEGLNWGNSKLVEIAYGIKKLQIMATIIDDLVSVDDIQDQIQAFSDHVQSTDIAAFNKI